MIDWLTLRTPVGALGPALAERVSACVGRVMCVDADGVLRWQRGYLDLDALRSDSVGLYWQVHGSVTGEPLLVIGGSPASVEYGINVFGSSDVRHCAGVLIRAASVSLGGVLPGLERWDCRRLDVTENYALRSASQVRQALRLLLAADASRARPRSMGGDTVGWNVGSDLQSGKAYAKGPQLCFLAKRGLAADVLPWQRELAASLLRLELKLGSRWWRRREANSGAWWELSEAELSALHIGYFGRFIGSMEVVDMGCLLRELQRVAPTEGQALAAHRTWALVRAVGRDNARGSMPRATWFRHVRHLRAAGLSDADLCAGTVVPFRRSVIQLDAPVRSWGELRAAVLS